MTDNESFIRAIESTPGRRGEPWATDNTPLLVFADFLDENDSPAQAAWLRAIADRRSKFFRLKTCQCRYWDAPGEDGPRCDVCETNKYIRAWLGVVVARANSNHANVVAGVDPDPKFIGRVTENPTTTFEASSADPSRTPEPEPASQTGHPSATS